MIRRENAKLDKHNFEPKYRMVYDNTIVQVKFNTHINSEYSYITH
jgi:hypothetical protein